GTNGLGSRLKTVPDCYLCPCLKAEVENDAPQHGSPSKGGGSLLDSEPARHFLVKKACRRVVWLHPLAIDDELRDGTFASAADDFLGRTRSGFDINFFEWYVVPLEEALGFAAVTTPEGRVDGDLHRSYCGSYEGRPLMRARAARAMEIQTRLTNADGYAW